MTVVGLPGIREIRREWMQVVLLFRTSVKVLGLLITLLPTKSHRNDKVDFEPEKRFWRSSQLDYTHLCRPQQRRLARPTHATNTLSCIQPSR